MTIKTHIQTLIFTHDCVILPKLGGFVTSYASAYIDYKSGKIYPPSKNILFNSKLQTNDGILVSHIAKLHNITYSEASSLIDNEVSTIKDNLNRGIPCHFNGIGTILQNKDGRLIFEPENSINFLQQSFGLPSAEIVRTVVSHRSDLKRNYTVKTFIRQGIAAAIAIMLIFVAGLNLPETNNMSQSSMLFISNQMITDINNEMSQERLYNSEIDDIVRFREYCDSHDKEVESNSDIVEAMEDDANESITHTSPTYHIIIGCFSSQNNVDKLINDLKSAGNMPSIQGVNKKGLTRVSINSYDSITEAEKALNQLDVQYDGAWILHY